MEETDKAYIAAFVDTDGAIYICKIQRKDRPRRFSVISWSGQVNISNTNQESILWAHEVWGGSMKERSWELSSKAAKQMTPNHRQLHYYQVIFTGQSALRLINDMLPYLKIKKRQAKLCKALILHNINKHMPRGPHDNASQREIKLKRYNERQRMYHLMRKWNAKGSLLERPTATDLTWTSEIV